MGKIRFEKGRSCVKNMEGEKCHLLCSLISIKAISRPARCSSDGMTAADCEQQNPAVEWNKLEAKDADNLGEGDNF